MMNSGLWILAMGAPPGGGGSSLLPVGYILIMVAMFYVLMIRPQQRKEKERRRMLDAVKSGDRVVFGGGLLGLVANVKDKTILIKIADNVKVEVTRGAVTQVLTNDEEPVEEKK